MAKKKALLVKDDKVKKLLRKGGRKGAKKDFLELLRRAVGRSTGLL
jgi:hypothetical protein